MVVAHSTSQAGDGIEGTTAAPGSRHPVTIGALAGGDFAYILACATQFHRSSRYDVGEVVNLSTHAARVSVLAPEP